MYAKLIITLGRNEQQYPNIDLAFESSNDLTPKLSALFARLVMLNADYAEKVVGGTSCAVNS